MPAMSLLDLQPTETSPRHRHIERHRATSHKGDGFRSIAGLLAALTIVLIALYVALPPAGTFIPSLISPQRTPNSPLKRDSPERDTLKEATMPPALSPLVIPAAGRHTATVIFAHGLGDSGHGWQDAIEMIRRRQKLGHVKFILPHAPEIPITVNGGFRMPGWFDIASLGGSAEQMRRSPPTEDEPGVLASRDTFNSLIQSEISAGIPSERIVLGGFSQGGAMSIFTGVTSPVRLGGIIGMSSWLLLSRSVEEHVRKLGGASGGQNKETPILMGHGTEDPVVRFDLGQESAKMLKEMGHDVRLEKYPGMQHSACAEELDEVAKFLVGRLPETAS